jgi:hypothetical protein
MKLPAEREQLHLFISSPQRTLPQPHELHQWVRREPFRQLL